MCWLTMKSFVYPMMSPFCFSLVAKILQDRKILDWLYSTGYCLAHLPHLKDFPRIKSDNFNLTRVLLNWVPLIKLKPTSSPPDERPIRREKNTFQSQEDVNTKPTKLPEMQENAGNQVVIDFSFEHHHLRRWWKFPRLITDQSKAENI